MVSPQQPVQAGQSRQQVQAQTADYTTTVPSTSVLHIAAV
jgi:hypothetical protein